MCCIDYRGIPKSQGRLIRRIIQSFTFGTHTYIMQFLDIGFCHIVWKQNQKAGSLFRDLFAKLLAVRFLKPRINNLNRDIISRPLRSRSIFADQGKRRIGAPLPDKKTMKSHRPANKFRLFRFPLDLTVLSPTIVNLINFHIEGRCPRSFKSILFLQRRRKVSSLFFRLQRKILIEEILFSFLVSDNRSFLLAFWSGIRRSECLLQILKTTFLGE